MPRIGYYIPAGTVVVPNVFALSQLSDDPCSFNPERFLSEDSTPANPTEYIFGFGRRYVHVCMIGVIRVPNLRTTVRRACPGRYLAENSIFVIIANILVLFDISAPPKGPPCAEDEPGAKHPSEVNFGPYLVRFVQGYIDTTATFCSLFDLTHVCVNTAIPRSSAATSYHVPRHARTSLSKHMLRTVNRLHWTEKMCAAFETQIVSSVTCVDFQRRCISYILTLLRSGNLLDMRTPSVACRKLSYIASVA